MNAPALLTKQRQRIVVLGKCYAQVCLNRLRRNQDPFCTTADLVALENDEAFIADHYQEIAREGEDWFRRAVAKDAALDYDDRIDRLCELMRQATGATVAPGAPRKRDGST